MATATAWSTTTSDGRYAPFGGGGGGTQLGGIFNLDDFTGNNDDARFAAARSFAISQPYDPVIAFSNKAYTFNNQYDAWQGMRLWGTAGMAGTEFRSTNQITVPSGGLFRLPTAKDYHIQGLSFRSASNGAWVVPGAQSGANGVWTDMVVSHCGFYGFGPNFFSGALTRANWQYWYVNSGQDTQIKIGGSDSALWTEGVSFMSCQAPLSRDIPHINTGALSNSKIGKMYVTPQGGYAIRIVQPSMGLVLDNFTSTDWSRTGVNATQRAALKIEGGTGCVVNNMIIFYSNTAGLDQGDVMVTGGEQHTFVSPTFVMTHNGYTSPNLVGSPTPQIPCIYTTVPIRVIAPIAVGGRPKVLQQATAGLLNVTGVATHTTTTSSDPQSWRIVTGTGFTT